MSMMIAKIIIPSFLYGVGGGRDFVFSVAKSFGRIRFATCGFGRRVAANRSIGDRRNDGKGLEW